MIRRISICAAGVILMLLTGCADSVFEYQAEKFTARQDISDGEGWMIADGDFFVLSEGERKGHPVLTRAKDAKGSSFIEYIGSRAEVLPGDNKYIGRTVDYRVEVKMPGFYRLYVRWCGTSGSSDSFYAMVLDSEGNPARDPACIMFFSDPNDHGKWVWGSSGCADSADIDIKNTVRAEWYIDPGVYTIRLASREPGTAIDALVFQNSFFSAPE
jgi:hypothetical protein